MSQADFARKLGVSRAAVSQWKTKDILREDAFSGEGKKGKIRFDIALEQVRRNRDIGQSLGNGIATRTCGDAPAGTGHPAPRSAAAEAPADPPRQIPLQPASPEVIEPFEPDAPAPAPLLAKVDSIEDQLKRAKLEEQLRRNRLQAADEAVKAGTLMAADDAREQLARIAGMMLQIFEGALPDLAAAVSGQFNVPQRDVLHLLRAEMVKVRRAAAMKERARAEAAQKDVTTEIDLED
ncbi:hypothetical protein [Pseudooceanicola sp. HF7]|uniref:hypothetical protein n=1 Tax=Pseudooceanicola sp. HF7 TaxID=2721560 RepID=UPI001C378856|nr:hypothetical protein [Pseudooceanicola sp. HF7]